MILRQMAIAFLAGVLLAGVGGRAADDKKKDEPAEKSGTVAGIVTAKGENWLEVKADGEERPRRYSPNWVGGLPKDGGGFDKEIMKNIKEVTIGSRVRVEWKFHERPRAVKIEVLKKAEAKGEKKGS
jgi:hypothetical protein